MTNAATSTRPGTGPNNADGAAVFTTENGTTAAAVIDLIGHQDSAPRVTWLLAETAARTAAQRGGLAGLLTAALLITDPGASDDPEPDGVAVIAVTRPDGHTVISWAGDSHAYGWDGQRLYRYTTPHTYGQQLREHGAPWEIAEDHNDWIVTSLSHATPTGILTVACNDPLVILCSDGLDPLGADGIAALIRQHGDDPQKLADALTTAVPDGDGGYRDDVTVVVISTGEQQ